VTPPIRDRGVRAVLLDIEGTTTPIAFVYEVLFPFARAHVSEYLRDNQDSSEVREVAALLSAEHAGDVNRGEGPPAWHDGPEGDALASLAAYALSLMDRDRKSPGLKLLQGYIWERGYRNGVLRGEVFPDVPPAMRRWHDAGLDLAIYSSGSVLAQRLLFQSTTDGDLTTLLCAFFDTAAGPKTSRESYARIVRGLGQPPGDVLFVSDVTSELAAARAAGLHTLLSIRPGNPPQPDAAAFEAIGTFDEI
jgi:enolase-phosphatase E1